MKKIKALILSVVFLIVSFSIVGHVHLSDNLQSQCSRPVGEIYGSHTVGQTFVSHQARLSRVDVLLATYARKNTQPLIFHLKSSPSSPDDIVTITVDAIAIKDNAYHRFSFSPLLDSKGKSYYFFLESPQSEPGNAITVWHSPYDAYAEGRLYIDGQPREGDLAFRTYYDYTLEAMARDVWNGTMHSIPLILLTIALFLLPGYVLFILFLSKSEFDVIQRLIISTCLSIVFYPLLLLACTLVKFKMDAFRAAAMLAILGGIVLWSLVKEKRGQPIKAPFKSLAINPIYFLLLFIFALSLGVRLFIVRDLPAPMWTDSYHHTLISQLIIERGYIPDSYEPYAHLPSFTYHFGFHTLVAFFHWLTGIDIVRSVILVGQIVNALSPLTAYLLAVKLLRSSGAGLFSALIVGLLSNMPAYYVNWGRYTQLTGQLILPTALIITLRGLENEERSLKYLIIAAVSLAGLFLTHYRVVAFYLCFMVVYFLYQGLTSGRGKLIELVLRMLLISLLAVLLTLPWLWNVVSNFVPKQLQAYHSLANGNDIFSDPLIRQYFSFPTRLVLLSFNSYLIALSLLGCIWGIIEREEPIILIVLWLIALFVMANLYLLKLPFSGLVNNGAVIVGLYLPGSILGGYFLDRLTKEVLAKMRPQWLRLSKVAIALAMISAALLGARRMLDIIEPSYALISKSDMQAMDWIRRNVPKEAKFLSDSSFWLPNAIIGSDAGLWIPLLTGRETIVPPMTYVNEGTLEYVKAINALAKDISASADAEKILPLLKRYGVTHIYIGKRSWKLRPQEFIDHPSYRLVYHRDGVWIFQVDYEKAAITHIEAGRQEVKEYDDPVTKVSGTTVLPGANTMAAQPSRSCTYTAFLPLIIKHGPPQAKLGVDFGALITDTDVLDNDLPLVKEMGAQWVRVFLPWLEIEKAPGEYSWDTYDAVFDSLKELGFNSIVVVYGAPDWAAEQNCGPISDTVALENFLDALIPRYAEAVNAWEFINEPDGRVPHEYGPVIGCWGLHPTEYAQQLGIFYSKVRDLDPDALIFFGGLAYDNWAHFERGFFEEALQNGAGRYFDGVSLHYYPINPEEFPTMAHKVNEIRDTMSNNGVHNKRIWVTETGMWVNLNGSVELQRDFIVREFARGFGAGVDNIFWFDPREHPTSEGAVHRWLISINHEPINGYSTFQHLARELEGMHCVGPYRGVPEDVEAYKFIGSERSLYILWSNAITETVRIPSTTDATLISRDGDKSTVIPAQMGMVEFEVGEKPVFLEISESDQAGQ